MRSIQIPRTLTIAGQVWHVYYDRDCPESLASKLKPGHYGVCVFSARVIILASWQTPDEMQETFIHEVLHAFFAEDEWLGPELEHHVIETLESRLTRFI